MASLTFVDSVVESAIWDNDRKPEGEPSPESPHQRKAVQDRRDKTSARESSSSSGYESDDDLNVQTECINLKENSEGNKSNENTECINLKENSEGNKSNENTECNDTEFNDLLKEIDRAPALDSDEDDEESSYHKDEDLSKAFEEYDVLSRRKMALSILKGCFEYPEYGLDVPVEECSSDSNCQCSLHRLCSDIPTDDLWYLSKLSLDFSPELSQPLEQENGASCVKDSEDLDVTSAMKELRIAPKSLNIDELLAENRDELDNKIHFHRVTMENIVKDIIRMTKAAEDSIQDSEKHLVNTFDDLIKFQNVEPLGDSPPESNSPEKDVCPTEECPEGVRPPTTKTSDFLSNVNSAVQFLHGFCSAQNSPRYEQQKSNYVAPLFGGLKVSCGDWCNSAEPDLSDYILFRPQTVSQASSSGEVQKPCLPVKFNNCEPEEQVMPQAKLPQWLTNASDAPSSVQKTHPSPELQNEKQSLKTFFGSSASISMCSGSSTSISSDLGSVSSPVEEFFNSLYLPDDLAFEMISGTSGNKRRLSVDNLLLPSHYENAEILPSKETRSLPPPSSFMECAQSDSDIWGDKGETYWKPLPRCHSNEDSSRQQHDRNDYSRLKKRTVKSVPTFFPSSRYTPKSRNVSGTFYKKFSSHQ